MAAVNNNHNFEVLVQGLDPEEVQETWNLYGESKTWKKTLKHIQAIDQERIDKNIETENESNILFEEKLTKVFEGAIVRHLKIGCWTHRKYQSQLRQMEVFKSRFHYTERPKPEPKSRSVESIFDWL